METKSVISNRQVSCKESSQGLLAELLLHCQEEVVTSELSHKQQRVTVELGLPEAADYPELPLSL